MSPAILSEVARNRREVIAAIHGSCAASKRDPADVRLVAVSKKHPASRILEMSAAGQRDFGENYLQEAVQKIVELSSADQAGSSLIWHFIGHIQSRKCRDIAEHFDWVHTVESAKVARKLDSARGEQPEKSALNVLIQVNIDDEESKSGVPISRLSELAREITALEHVILRGLMIIPRAVDDTTTQHEVFARCRRLLEALRGDVDAASRPHLDQLSMGMSGDMKAAIAEGATMVRIGTALFGQRPA